MRRIAVVLVLALAGGAAVAQSLPNPFDAGLSVRAMGFGGSGLALAEGTDALLYNPAGLALARGLRADSSLSSVLGLYSVTWIAGALPNLGGGVAYLGVGGITDPQGNPLTFSHLALVLGLGLDLAPFRVFPFPAAGGVNLKFNRVQIGGEAGSGFALDVGVLGRSSTPFGALQFAFTLRDLGLGMRVGDTADGWSIDFGVGGALVSPLGLLFVADLTSEYTALGLGWGLLNLLEVRAGLRLEGGVRWALGLGVKWGTFALDYALLTHPVLAASHRFGFGVRF